MSVGDIEDIDIAEMTFQFDNRLRIVNDPKLMHNAVVRPEVVRRVVVFDEIVDQPRNVIALTIRQKDRLRVRVANIEMARPVYLFVFSRKLVATDLVRDVLID